MALRQMAKHAVGSPAFTTIQRMKVGDAAEAGLAELSSCIVLWSVEPSNPGVLQFKASAILRAARATFSACSPSRLRLPPRRMPGWPPPCAATFSPSSRACGPQPPSSAMQEGGAAALLLTFKGGSCVRAPLWRLFCRGQPPCGATTSNHVLLPQAV